MKNLELSIQREINFMIKHNLDANELFILKLIFYAQDNHDEFISRYFNSCSCIDLRTILISLQEKEIITKQYIIPDKGIIFNPKDVTLNKNLIKSFLQHSESLGMELFENYPGFTIINGRTFSLKNITKLYKSLDDMCFAYGQEIKFNLETHKEVLELLEWGKENNQISNGICDFIASRQWLLLKELRDKGQGLINTNELV